MSKRADLKNNDAFCIIPWVGVYQCPDGSSGACCLNMFDTPESGYNFYSTVHDITNCPEMKQLRLDMLAGKKDHSCNLCYNKEAVSEINSYRQNANEIFADHYDIIDTMLPDGTIPDPKARLIDIRFDKLCSMKCRSCGEGFSTLWETENRKHIENHQVKRTGVDRDKMLESIIEQVPYLEEIYFAGGEPLISQYHYAILKELIAQGRTDVRIRYNTNLGSLTYKNENVLDLWNHFDNQISLGVSLDHYGAKAEYIRHGVKWNIIESNYRQVLAHPNVDVIITTTITNLNYVTFPDFMEYMFDNGMMAAWMPNLATQPDEMRSQDLPEDLKQLGLTRMVEVVNRIKGTLSDPSEMPWLDSFVQTYREVVNTARNENNWQAFWPETERLDRIRSESLCDTFPELAEHYQQIPIVDQ